MSIGSKTITGVVKNGVIVPQAGSALPEGIEVTIVIPDHALTPELNAELRAWQEAGAQSWMLIDKWEEEDQ